MSYLVVVWMDLPQNFDPWWWVLLQLVSCWLCSNNWWIRLPFEGKISCRYFFTVQPKDGKCQTQSAQVLALILVYSNPQDWNWLGTRIWGIIEIAYYNIAGLLDAYFLLRIGTYKASSVRRSFSWQRLCRKAQGFLWLTLAFIKDWKELPFNEFFSNQRQVYFN